MKKTLLKGVCVNLVLICAVLDMWGMGKIASGASEILAHQKVSRGETSVVQEESLEQKHNDTTRPSIEPADAVLIRTKEWQWNRYLRNMLNLPDWVDFGLEHRTRFEVYDHPWRSAQPLGRTDPQIQQRSRVRFGMNGEVLKFLFEGQDSRVHLDDPGDFVTTATRNEWDILQIFVSATVRDVLGTRLRTDLHVGRLTMDFGRRRLVARNDFRNTINAFDGVHWQLTKNKSWRVRAFLVEPVLRDQVQLDEQSKRSVFWGVYGESTQLLRLHLHAYYFGLNDQRNTAINMQRTFSTFGFRFFRTPHTSQIDYEIESAWQTGKRGNTDHFAHFQHFDLGYTFDLPWVPRLLIYYDYASGDRNANDSQDSAFDTLFGARRFEYMPTGNFGPFFRTNISSPGWRVIFVPEKGWEVQLKQRFWYLASSRGAFARNGLRDSTGESGNVLGHDVELRVQWMINGNLEFDVGYDHWFKGSYFDRLPANAGLPPGGEKDTDYFYVLTKFRL